MEESEAFSPSLSLQAAIHCEHRRDAERRIIESKHFPGGAERRATDRADRRGFNEPPVWCGGPLITGTLEC